MRLTSTLRPTRTPQVVAGILAGLLLSTAAIGQRSGTPLVPETVALGEAARKAIEAEWLSEEERSDLRVFHGVWDDRDLTSVGRQAKVAIDSWDLDAAILADPSVPVEMRGEAAYRRGDLRQAIELLREADSLKAIRLTAEAFETLGDHESAERAAERAVEPLRAETITSAAELTEGVRALMVLARLQGQPARDFQSMMDLLGRAHQELDRLYWPAKLAEAELLLDKDNADEAIVALHETLRLNPRCSEAWYALGRVGLARFSFDSARTAATALQRQNARHPLADLLLAESRLVQDDPDGATELLGPLLERHPRLRAAHAYGAAAQALSYDEEALDAALRRYDELSPGSAEAYFIVGRHLSLARQYEASAAALETAIRRQPAWPAPRIELGLMELQSGREDRALTALRDVAELDPFNSRAANSLFLLEEMAGYEEVVTDHFIIRYRPGVDRVLVDMMPERLEAIHEIVATRFDFEPDRKTIIEVMPDHRRFAVRITGMPWIHTVAACTGPVIAMEVPREGKRSEHLGRFDWPRVLQHEYTHTITLAQTRNRIPHWLTEAAAVSMELAPREYDRCIMLAEAWRSGTLFDLDEIKWAFVRPKRPSDRSQAYAQGHWMVQYLNERFGESALIRLLDQYFEGQREEDAIPAALGISRERFFEDFLEWAATQVAAWGLDPQPPLDTLLDEVRYADPEMAVVLEASKQARLDAITRSLTGQIGRPTTRPGPGLRAADWPDLVRPPVDITDELLAEWLARHPDHPDLVELDVRGRIDRGDDDPEDLIPRLEHYAGLRPVDPFPHKKLAEIWLESGTPERAIEHLEALDALEEKSPVYAVKLAKLYRAAGQLDAALTKSTRALHLDPYHAYHRELAAAIAVESGNLATARRHIDALTLIEPDRPQHRKRLETIDRLMER